MAIFIIFDQIFGVEFNR